jgi:heme exporter protein D
MLLGIEDKYVWLAYLLCILSTLLCVIYGLARWNRGEEPVESADIRWAAKEDKVGQDL